MPAFVLDQFARKGCVSFSGTSSESHLLFREDTQRLRHCVDRRAGGHRRLGDQRRFLVTDDRVQRRDQGDRFPHAPRQQLAVGLDANHAVRGERQAGIAQMRDALEQAPAHDRLERIELQLAGFGGHGDRQSLPITSNATWFITSGITGLTLPGMIDEPACRGGSLMSPKPSRGRLFEREVGDHLVRRSCWWRCRRRPGSRRPRTARGSGPRSASRTRS